MYNNNQKTKMFTTAAKLKHSTTYFAMYAVLCFEYILKCVAYGFSDMGLIMLA